jgi:hypothetical protein
MLTLSACHSNPPGRSTEEPVHIEAIDGSEISRVVLTAKAAERLDVQTSPVRAQPVVRKRSFGGQVVRTDGGVLVRVPLSASVLNQVDQGLPAYARPLSEEAAVWPARVVETPDAKEAASALYCRIDGVGYSLSLEQRVLVEVSMLGSDAIRKVIPYSAVLYDLHGNTWAYARVEPLTFERALIVVDYIEGDLAVLAEGPPAGTEVVTTGAAELFGAESGIGGAH